MFINTIRFSEAAEYFKQHGYYTPATLNSLAYGDFWDEEKRRIIEGHTINGVRITGLHYFYLNYVQIKALSEETKGGSKKRLGFPRFLDVDHEYFCAVERARSLGKGMIVAKARRKGFSYKNAAFCVWNTYFFKETYNVIAAFEGDYCETTMKFCSEMISHIDKTTAFKKRKLVFRSKEEIKLGYKEIVDGIEIESGTKSELRTLSFKNEPSKSIGKSVDLFLFEEAGKWPGLIKAYEFTQPTFQDGDIMIGMPLIFGTGGDMANGSVDFSQMFYNPNAFNLLAFDNIWDRDSTGKCGYFVPETKYRLPYVDEYGNSMEDLALKALHQEREEKLKANNRNAYQTLITQKPLTPKEAFLSITGNIFPTVALQEHLQSLLVSNKGSNAGQKGELSWVGDRAVKWKPNDKVFEAPYPFDANNVEGCVVIYEHPVDDAPFGLYIAGTDPYVQDSANTSDSLGSTFVYKRFFRSDSTSDIIVAEYTGRPENSEVYYDNLHKLLVYYNARCLFENNTKDVKIYFQNKNCLYLLQTQPEIISDIVKNSGVHRGYGMHMNGPIKLTGEQYILDWLVAARGEDKLNLHSIQSIFLLKELIVYSRNGNFDRVMAFMFVLFFAQEVFKRKVKDLEAKERVKMFASMNEKLGWM